MPDAEQIVTVSRPLLEIPTFAYVRPPLNLKIAEQNASTADRGCCRIASIGRPNRSKVALRTSNQEAVALVERRAACRVSGNRLPFAAHAGYAYGRSGYRVKAQAVLDHLEELRATRYVSAYETAVIYLALEDLSAAAQWLERSLQERAAKLTEILDPVFDGVRDHPVLHKIMCELGLTQQSGSAGPKES